MKEVNTAIYSVVIIDDEQPARDGLRTILNLKFPELEVIGEADSVAQGMQLLNSIQPDVLFLDINLSDGSGFNLLEQLKTIDFQIVFITAYDSHAIRAFQVNALDYVMKPVSVADLRKVFEKIVRYENKLKSDDIRVMQENWRELDSKQRKLVIREHDGIRYVPVTQIRRCQSHSNYTKIHLTDGEEIMTSRTLKEHAGLLEGHGFFRIYQSHLVNLSMIKKIINHDGLYVEMDNGDLLELSRKKKQLLYEEMEQFGV